jgi:hypothetical protein
LLRDKISFSKSMKINKSIFLIIILILLSSCGSLNIYKISFNETDNYSSEIHNLCGDCEIEIKEFKKTNNFLKEYYNIIRQGHVLVGYSEFKNNIPYNLKYSLINFSKEIGATKINTLAYPVGTATNSIFISGNSEYSFEGSRIGTYSNNYVKGSRIGEQYSNNESNSNGVVTYRNVTYLHTIFYFKKLNKLPNFGMLINDLSDEKRQEIKRNTGVQVDIIFDDSQAYYADILEDDVIIQLDDLKINNISDFDKFFYNLFPQTKEVKVKLLRDDEIIDLILSLE